MNHSIRSAPWQIEPCPPWCRDSEQHWADTSSDDRVHYSRHEHVDLHTMDMQRIDGRHHELDHASLWIEQGYREVVPASASDRTAARGCGSPSARRSC